jgi:hypothetical protein
VVAKRADQSSPRVDVEKQARNLNTKGTKRTKKKEIDAWRSIELCLHHMDNLFRGSRWVYNVFFVRFVPFVFKIFAVLLLDIRHNINLP